VARLPNTEFQQLVPKLREKDSYKPQEPRRISWPEYNLAQINEAKELLIFIRGAVDCCESIDVVGRVGRPLTNPKDLAKAVLACELLQLPERQAQGWLEIIGPFLGIRSKLDDRVIGKAYDRWEVAHILKQVFNKTKDSDGKLSGDGTGLETSRKQNYELTKNKSVGQYLVSIVDSREIVQAFDISGTQECQIMHNLIKEVVGKSLSLDAAFTNRDLIDEIVELGLKPYVFPKKNIKLNGHIAWKLMYLSLYHDIQSWLKEYHRRSHSESFHSSFKRRNKPILKISPLSRLNQITARIIIHNIKRLSYFNKLAQS